MVTDCTVCAMKLTNKPKLVPVHWVLDAMDRRVASPLTSLLAQSTQPHTLSAQQRSIGKSTGTAAKS